MSQFILDEQLSVEEVLKPIQKWTPARMIHELRPHERITDDRIPALLRELRKPTFISIDEAAFWKRQLCDRRYGIAFFALRCDQQREIPSLLRSLTQLSEFDSRAKRMGKVIRISRARIRYCQTAVRLCFALVFN